MEICVSIEIVSSLKSLDLSTISLKITIAILLSMNFKFFVVHELCIMWEDINSVISFMNFVVFCMWLRFGVVYHLIYFNIFQNVYTCFKISWCDRCLITVSASKMERCVCDCGVYDVVVIVVYSCLDDLPTPNLRKTNLRWPMLNNYHYNHRKSF